MARNEGWGERAGRVHGGTADGAGEECLQPHDPDMDKDGVKDGQEVAQGSDPFFPDQATDVSPELSKEVSDFLTKAIQLQIEAYRKGDANIAAPIMAGDIFTVLESEISGLNQQGLVQISEIDLYKSNINDIRVISNTNIEVDTCDCVEPKI